MATRQEQELQEVEQKLRLVEADMAVLKDNLNRNQLVNGFYSLQDMQHKLMELGHTFDEGVNYFKQLEQEVINQRNRGGYGNYGSYGGNRQSAPTGYFNSNSGGMFDGVSDNSFMVNSNNHNNDQTPTTHKKKNIRHDADQVDPVAKSSFSNYGNAALEPTDKNTHQPPLRASQGTNFKFDTLYPFAIANAVTVKNEYNGVCTERVLYNCNDNDETYTYIDNESEMGMFAAEGNKILITRDVKIHILDTPLNMLGDCTDFLDILKTNRYGSLSVGLRLDRYLSPTFTGYIRGGLYVNGIKDVPTDIFEEYEELTKVLKTGKVKDYDVYKTMLEDINDYISVIKHDDRKELVGNVNYITNFVKFDECIAESVLQQGESDQFLLTPQSNLALYNTIMKILEEGFIGRVAVVVENGTVYNIMTGSSGILLSNGGSI